MIKVNKENANLVNAETHMIHQKKKRKERKKEYRVQYREGQKVTSPITSSGGDGRKDIGIAHIDHNGSVSEPGNLACFDGDDAGPDLEIFPKGPENLPSVERFCRPLGRRRRTRRLGDESLAVAAEETYAEATTALPTVEGK